LVNEAKAGNVTVAASQVFGVAINSDPAQAVTDGVAEHVVCTLVLDSTSNGLSYQATYPTGHPLAGQNVSNIIPQAFGDGYRPILKSNNVEVPPLDASNWFVTAASAVVTSETALSLVSGTLDCYRYIGQTVQQRLDATSGSDTETLTADVVVTNRQVVYVQGTHVVALGVNTTTAADKRVGIAGSAISSGNTGPVYLKRGAEITFSAGTFTGLEDQDIFVGATGGAWTSDISSFTSVEVVKIGKVKSATVLILDPQVIIA
jgi:hypothetical protein